jgi:hypothetical protein
MKKNFVLLILGLTFLFAGPNLMVSKADACDDGHGGNKCEQTETRTKSCDAGFTGEIIETRKEIKGHDNKCFWGSWKETSNTCTINTYELTVEKDGTGSGTVNGGGTYDYGTTQTATAVADTDSTFSGWTGDCDMTGTVLMDGPKTCTATFTKNSTPVEKFTVTATAGANGAITPATQETEDGTSATLTVTPNSGYTVTMGGTCPAGTLVDTTYTTGNIEADCTVTATFTKIPADSANLSATKIVCPTVDLLPTWGAGGPDVTSTTASAFLEANPTCHSTPWTFEWAPSSAVNPGDQVEVAGGAWTSFTGNTTIPTGAKVWVREQFNNDYIPFTGVTTTNSNSAGLYCSTDVLNYDNYDSINTVNKNNTYYCVGFNVLKSVPVDTFTVTSSAIGNGTITPALQEATSGTSVTLTVTPNSGYTVTMGGTCPAGTLVGTTYTTGDISADCSVTATFTQIPENSYVLTVVKDGTGSGEVTGNNGTYVSGTIATLTATPSENSTLIGWSTNCPGGIVTVTSTTTCTVTFNLKPEVDLCPNIDEIQTSVPSGKYINDDGDCVNSSSGRRSGSTRSSVIYQCSDNRDNDNDGLIDELDPGCHFDSNPNNPLSYDRTDNSEAGEVLGEATTCGIYVDKYMRKGLTNNDPVAVKKVQIFLNDYMGSGLVVDGVFGTKTDAAVRAFQVKQFGKVLAPWGLESSTGIFYLTTQTEVNNIMCPPLNLPIPPLVPINQNPNFPQF